MNKPLNIGLIGAGGIGAYHRASIEALEKTGLARLIAIADPWADRLAAAKTELESRGVRWHLDYRDMLNNENDLDAVVIATPIPCHYEMTKAALHRRVMVHLEKPPVPLLSQLEELISLDTTQSISVGFQFIASKCVQTLKQLISTGKLGPIREIRGAACWPRLDNYYSRANWAGKMTLDGDPVFDGPITNALAHLIHNIMYLATESRHEFAVPVEVSGELYRARPSLESYDTACMRGHFKNGVNFAVAVTHATESALPFQIKVQGANGWARISQDGAQLLTSEGVICDAPETTQQLLDVNHANFIDAINHTAPRFFTRLTDTRGYVASTNAVLLSSASIHNIPPASIRRYEKDGQNGYDVVGLREAVEATIENGKLFGEQALPWAIAKPIPISIPFDPAAISSHFSH
jgi:predicted dehydrogenase